METVDAEIFGHLGGVAGCKRLARSFYARVAKDPELRPLFPGKSLRCATEEFAAFLVQFFDGDEAQSQFRWRLSLRESHARFRIRDSQKTAWLKHMHAAIDIEIEDAEAGGVMKDFFDRAAAAIVHRAQETPANAELAERWSRQIALDQLVADLAAGRDVEATALALQFKTRRSVYVGILARLMESGRSSLVDFVLRGLEQDPDLSRARYNGRALLHFAAGSGCLPVVQKLLAMGTDPNTLEDSGHTALYRVADGCGAAAGPEIVRELVRAGAEVDACRGATRSTSLHAAARRGNLPVAEALLSLGASPAARDTRGLTPLDRANNCRKFDVAAILGD